MCRSPGKRQAQPARARPPSSERAPSWQPRVRKGRLRPGLSGGLHSTAPGAHRGVRCPPPLDVKCLNDIWDVDYLDWRAAVACAGYLYVVQPEAFGALRATCAGVLRRSHPSEGSMTSSSRRTHEGQCQNPALSKRDRLLSFLRLVTKTLKFQSKAE